MSRILRGFHLAAGLVPLLALALATPAARGQDGEISITLGVDNVAGATFETSQDEWQTGGGNGAAVVVGTQLPATVGVSGVTQNDGTTNVTCYANDTQILNWSTSSNGPDRFYWSLSAAGTYNVYCLGSWSGEYWNTTLYTPIITIQAETATSCSCTASFSCSYSDGALTMSYPTRPSSTPWTAPTRLKLPSNTPVR